MAVSFLTPLRTVLLIGDEALYVYKVTHNAAKLLDSVPWQSDDFIDVVVGLIKKEGGGKPVLLVNDMTDQHFKGGQRLPKVGMMDKSSVLKRKLQVAFPNYPIRGALPVKAKKTKGADSKAVAKAGGPLYLFAAVPTSDPVVKTLEAVKISLAPIAGFVLLPVESSDMVRKMSEKLAGDAKKASRWTIFIGQHQSGALRQVITRDGQLAMTRMTPIEDQGSDPQKWANEVHQEFKATVSYLSRFGYATDDGTDVIVVGDKAAGDALEKLIEIPCNYSTYTAPQAARLLGMKIGMQEEQRYADPLHVSWIGRKNAFILPMEATDISKIHQPRQAVALAMLLLFCSGAYFAYDLSVQTQSMMQTKSDLSIQRSVLAEAESDYQNEVERMAALGINVEMIQNSLKAYQSFEYDRVPVLSFVKGVGEALGSELRLDNMTVEQIEPGGITVDRGEETVKEGVLEARLLMSFPPTIEPEYGIKTINDFETRLKEKFPDHDVRITRQVARPEYTQNIKGQSVANGQEVADKEDYIAELMIRGPNK